MWLMPVHLQNYLAVPLWLLGNAPFLSHLPKIQLLQTNLSAAPTDESLVEI